MSDRLHHLHQALHRIAHIPEDRDTKSRRFAEGALKRDAQLERASNTQRGQHHRVQLRGYLQRLGRTLGLDTNKIKVEQLDDEGVRALTFLLQRADQQLTAAAAQTARRPVHRGPARIKNGKN